MTPPVRMIEAFGAHHLALKGRRIEPAGHPQLGRFPQDAQARFDAYSSTTG